KPCAEVVPSLGVTGTLRASPWRHEELGGFCAVGNLPGVRAARIDSLAMQVSEATAAPAIALYFARGSWSYTIFEAGNPILSLESHLGRPTLDGELARSASLIGLRQETLALSVERCFDEESFVRFVDELGLRPFRVPPSATSSHASSHREADDPSATLEKIPPGTWAALPPLGVVLVKAVELRQKDGVDEPTYVIVNGMNTLELPVIRAERMGMRPIVSKEHGRAIFDFIDSGVAAPQREYDANRVKGWLDLVRTGDLEGIAKVFATLCALEDRRKLYSLEDALKASTLDWLSNELATALGKAPDVMERDLVDACD
ncbi:MAG TPA: hypothetical protein PK095_05730, partial [Myxococcota bacterium]|nr:hypothetical protein [Myxococcota bacterium]